jgi:hypothetical protein
MQIHFRDVEEQWRWAWTDGLRAREQREIAVKFPGSEQEARDQSITELLKFIEHYLISESKQILPGQTMRYGWTMLRFVRDEHNLSGQGTEILLIEEMEHPFSLVDETAYVLGVAHTMVLKQVQQEAMRRNRVSGDAVYPHRSQFALICKRVKPTTIAQLRPLMAHRAWEPDVRDSGWFIGCCDKGHDHDNTDELGRVHLIHLVEHFLALFPYVAMPVGTQLLFEESRAIIWRPGEQEGQVDPGELIASLP